MGLLDFLKKTKEDTSCKTECKSTDTQGKWKLKINNPDDKDIFFGMDDSLPKRKIYEIYFTPGEIINYSTIKSTNKITTIADIKTFLVDGLKKTNVTIDGYNDDQCICDTGASDYSIVAKFDSDVKGGKKRRKTRKSTHRRRQRKTRK
jgi:hypothetical protein